jgi:hypothetical protein
MCMYLSTNTSDATWTIRNVSTRYWRATGAGWCWTMFYSLFSLLSNKSSLEIIRYQVCILFSSFYSCVLELVWWVFFFVISLFSTGYPPEDTETQPHSREGSEGLNSLFRICSEHPKNVFERVKKNIWFFEGCQWVKALTKIMFGWSQDWAETIAKCQMFW